MKHVTSITQFTKKEIIQLITSASKIKKSPKTYANTCARKLVATLFFEPSTRTRLSFTAAALRLGAQVIGFDDAKTTSTAKGETLEDTIRIVHGYADAIVMRHNELGAAKRAANVSRVPIINAGDGSGEHPTQALLDIFTIYKERSNLKSQTSKSQSKIQNLKNLSVGFVGDLKYGRTVHSLAQGLAHFHPCLYFISPPSLKMPREIIEKLRESTVEFHELTAWNSIAKQIDVLYMTRVQKERFTTMREYNQVKNCYILNKKTASLFKKDCLFMHPLPRVGEIDPALDDDPRAIYFKEAHNGLWMRMAILLRLLDAK